MMKIDERCSQGEDIVILLDSWLRFQAMSGDAEQDEDGSCLVRQWVEHFIPLASYLKT